MADQSSPPAVADLPKFRVPPEAQQLTSRRVSFRSTVSDASLPDAYLEALENKRRQLDESIHKYIASKEREYKNFEKEIKHQHKLSGSSNGVSASTTAANSTERHTHSNGEDFKRRSSSESTVLSAAEAGSSSSSSRKLSAIAAIVSEGMRKSRSDSNAIDDDEIWKETKAAIAGLTDRRESIERDKEFVGLFTPTYLSAIDDQVGRGTLERATSDPANLGSTSGTTPQSPPEELPRAHSDSAVQEGAMAKPRRPAQIQIASRTSSSGSSADGRLASALKSPTQKQRPKRKRVSLAVGDSIVAPSDSVPASQLAVQSLTPSHSRVRSSTRESPAETMANVPDHESVLVRNSKPADMSSETRAEQIMGGSRAAVHADHEADADELHVGSPPQAADDAKHITSSPPQGRDRSALSRSSSSKLDPDGDLFDLEEEEDDTAFDTRSKVRADEDLDGEDVDSEDEEGITGRVDEADLQNGSTPRTSNVEGEEELAYDSAGALVQQHASLHDNADTVEANGAVLIEYRPQSAAASQQPTHPGFRRPSVSADPIFRGSLVDYSEAERKAVDDEIYGSSFARPTSKGSFKGGSLGESFMEKNAADLMRARAARREAEVRS